MIKRGKINNKLAKAQALGIILNLVIAIVAVSVIISLESGVVGADLTPAEIERAKGLLKESGRRFTDEENKLLGKYQNEMGSLLNFPSDLPAIEPTPSQAAAAATLPEVKVGGKLKSSWEEQVEEELGPQTDRDTELDDVDETLDGDGEEGGYGYLAKLFKVEGPLVGNLLQGVQWAGVAYGATAMIGGLIGLDDEPWFTAAQAGLSAGLFAYQATQGLATKFAGAGAESFFAGSGAGIVGLGVGIAVFLLMYKDVSYKTVSFNCMQWEAPIGGDDCEKCNDELEPCSEYRCRSLGQACGLVNVGTSKELCVDLSKGDVKSPSIRPWKDVLTDGYRYIPAGERPPEWGTRIARQGVGKGCIAAFTPIEFGIQTDKPAQCKIGFNIEETYDEMEFYFGEDSLYKYNHTQRLNLPSPDAINDFAEADEETTGGLTIQNDGRYELFVRCRSANGYYNRDAYIVKFCVDEGPDTTPPVIEEFSIEDGSPVQFEVDELEIIAYVNEPADCKWSKTDQNFENMENEMECAKNLWEMESNMYYACKGDLTGIEDRKANKFYFRCKDQPWMSEDKRNTMAQSKILNLLGTQPLNIDIGSIRPVSGDTISGATTTVPVYLELQTQNGYKDGEAECYYSLDNSTFVGFYETNSHKHKQRQDLKTGLYTYYFRCVDLGGNADSAETSFTVYVDTAEPTVVRVLYYSDSLEIITDEDAVCYYSVDDNTACNYEIGEGSLATQMVYSGSNDNTKHFGEWYVDTNYYIKCMDENGKQPLPTQCSIIVRPVEIEE